MSNKNAEIRAAIDAFELEQARILFREVLRNGDADAETYYQGSRMSLDSDQQTEFLEQAIKLDPFHEKARTTLKQLKGGATPIEAEAETPNEVKQKLPSNQSSEKPKGEKIFVEGVIESSSSVIMYTVPNIHGKVRTELLSDATVYLIARYDDTYGKRWYQVVYNSPVTAVFGWMQSEHITKLSVQEQAVQPLDLPITEFQLNSRAEFEETINQRVKMNSNRMWPYMWRASLLCSLIGVICAFLIDPWSLTILFGAFMGSMIGISIGQIYYLYPRNGKLISEEIAELKRIQKILRSEREIAHSEQLQMMAFDAALKLGTNVVTRMVPDRR